MAPPSFARHMLGAWARSGRGRAVLAAWAIVAAGLSLSSALARRRAKKAAVAVVKRAAALVVAPAAGGALVAAAPAVRAAKQPSATRLVLRALVPTWRSTPVAHATSLALAIGLRRWAATRMSSEIGVLGGLLATRDWDALFAREISFAIWALPTAALAAATQYATARLALSLRSRLEQKWRKSVRTGAALRVAAVGAAGSTAAAGVKGGATTAVAAGDEAVGAGALTPAEVGQIFCAESDALCTELAALCAGVTKPLLEAAMLTVTLGQLMGAKQLLGALGFFAVAGGWVRSIGPAFASLRERQASASSALAARHARLQLEAEGVSALGAEAAEASSLEQAWELRAAASTALELQQLLAGTVETYTLRYLGILAAFAAMSPAVYLPAGAGISLAAAAGATEYFLSSLHLLVDLGLCMRDLAVAHRTAKTAEGLSARTLRLLHALEAAETAAAAATGPSGPAVGGGRRMFVEADCLSVSYLTISAPLGADASAGAPLASPLVLGLSLELGPGETLLVRGGNGTGKTALLRVLSGWWSADAGEVRVPTGRRVGYLPQRPLVVAEHSLREALLYPTKPKSASAPAGRAGGAKSEAQLRDQTDSPFARREPSEGELRAALREVGLEALVAAAEARAGGAVGALDAPGACEGLSGGEAQRLAAARALLARPHFLLLDEPAAATSAEFEQWLFPELARRSIGVVTVSHAEGAERWHARVLELGGAGGSWTLRAAAPLAA